MSVCPAFFGRLLSRFPMPTSPRHGDDVPYDGRPDPPSEQTVVCDPHRYVPGAEDGSAMSDRSSNPPFMHPTLHNCELNPGCLNVRPTERAGKWRRRDARPGPALLDC
jgi:hypothetical protein